MSPIRNELTRLAYSYFPPLMEVKSITPDGLFRLFTACPDDTKTFILDVRPQKEFQKAHIMQSYCIRLAANGQALLVGSTPLSSEACL